MKIEKIKPEEIEKRSFEIITEILGDKKLAPENEKVRDDKVYSSRFNSVVFLIGLICSSSW